MNDCTHIVVCGTVRELMHGQHVRQGSDLIDMEARVEHKCRCLLRPRRDKRLVNVDIML